MALAKPSHTNQTVLSRLDNHNPGTITAMPDLDLSDTYSTNLLNVITQLLSPDPLQRPRIQSLLLTGPIMSILQGSPPLSPLRQRRPEAFPAHPGLLIKGPTVREHALEDVTISGLSNIDHRDLSVVDADASSARKREMDLETVIKVLNTGNKNAQQLSTSKPPATALNDPISTGNLLHEPLPVIKTAIHLTGVATTHNEA